MTLPWRIAIIDDERSVRSGLSNLLESEGYATHAFDSAEVFLSHPFALPNAALVITDIKLRGMSGLELFEKLRLLAAPPTPCSLSPVMLMKICSGTPLAWAPLHFCVSPLTSIFCWIIFSGSWPADNKDRG